MWYYYLAKEYIDMGYWGLHLGNYDAVSKNDQPNFAKSYMLFKWIRDYASSLGKDQFIWINADIDRDLYYNGTNNLLLDFNSSPLRPEDTYNNYAGLPCDGQSNTELNISKYCPKLINSTGGIAPNGCRYSKTPILFNLDWCCAPDPNAPHYTGSGWHPWGYDEMTWFKSLSTDECRAYWLESIACAIKNDVVYRGYLKLPVYEYEWPMADHPIITDVVKNIIWKVNDHTNFTIAHECKMICQAEGTIEKYILKVTNPDCSSIYTFHIRQPNGNWLPFTFGNQREFEPTMLGKYTIILRQDNLGLPVGFQTQTIQLEKTLEIDQMDECKIVPTNPEGNPLRPLPTENDNNDSKSLNLKQERIEDFNVSVYPNPSSGMMSIKYELKKAFQVAISICDMNGDVLAKILEAEMSNGGKKNINYDGKLLGAGIYMIYFKINESIFTKQITILK